MTILWLLGHLVIAALCVPLAIIDFRELRLPNPLTLAVAVTAVATVVVGASGSGRTDWMTAMLLGSLAFGGPLLLVHLVKPSAMGFGDVKLAAGLGLLLGWYGPILGLRALMWGLLLAAPHSAWALFQERRAKKSEVEVPRTRIAFGPYLILSALLILAFSYEVPA